MNPRGGPGVIAIASALPREQAGLRGRWRPPKRSGNRPSSFCPDPRLTAIAGAEVVRGCSGIGCARTESALRGLFQGHNVSLLIFMGFAGGLDPGLAAGDVLRVDRVLQPDGTVLRLPDVAEGLGASVRRGGVATVNRVVSTIGEKSALFKDMRARGAVAVDMESAAVARMARAHCVDCVILRAISDPSNRELPAEAIAAVAADGGVDGLALVRGCLRRPAAVLDLLRLHAAVRRAGRNLAETVRAVLTARRAPSG